MSETTIWDRLGPIDEWLISPAQIEAAATGMCEHLKAVWDCQPCLVERLMVCQFEFIADNLGVTKEQAAEIARMSVARAARGEG